MGTDGLGPTGESEQLVRLAGRRSPSWGAASRRRVHDERPDREQAVAPVAGSCPNSAPTTSVRPKPLWSGGFRTGRRSKDGPTRAPARPIGRRATCRSGERSSAAEPLWRRGRRGGVRSRRPSQKGRVGFAVPRRCGERPVAPGPAVEKVGDAHSTLPSRTYARDGALKGSPASRAFGFVWVVGGESPMGPPSGPWGTADGYDFRSKRSSSVILVHAATKSFTNFG